jgi:chromosome partitioning protein
MTKVIAFANQKGGTGKTTTAMNTAGALSEMGHDILLIDIDPQASLSLGFGVSLSTLTRTLHEALMNPRELPLDDLIIKVRDKIDLVPTNISLADAELDLVSARRREDRLRRLIEPVKEDYDFVLMDCSPSLSLLVVNALSAADGVVIPMSTDYYSLAGVRLLLNSIDEIQYEVNPRLKVYGVLPTRFRVNTNIAREALESVRKTLAGKVHVFETVIRETVRLTEAPAHSKTITEYSPEHGSAEDYRQFARELLEQL